MAQELTDYTPPKFMTEREARLVGGVSNRLSQLRGMVRQGIRSGQLNVQTANGGQHMPLLVEEAEALISLLIERDEQLLIGMNIELDPDTPRL